MEAELGAELRLCFAPIKDGPGCWSFPGCTLTSCIACVLPLTPTIWRAKTGDVSAFHLGSPNAKRLWIQGHFFQPKSHCDQN